MTRWLRDVTAIGAGVYLALALYYLTLNVLVILPAWLRW